MDQRFGFTISAFQFSVFQLSAGHARRGFSISGFQHFRVSTDCRLLALTLLLLTSSTD
jgi:hypothetical protein